LISLFADNFADRNQEWNGGILGTEFGYKTATNYQWRIEGTIFVPKYAPLTEG